MWMNLLGMEHRLSQLADVYLPPWRLFHLDTAAEADCLPALFPTHCFLRSLSAGLAIHLFIQPDR